MWKYSQRTFIAALLIALCSLQAQAATVTYNFDFSEGGVGSFLYDDTTGTASSIQFDFGLLGSIAPYGFSSGGTTQIFGNPIGEFIAQDNTFFGMLDGASRLRIKSDGTYCIRADLDTCTGGINTIVEGTYSLSAVPVPAAVWLFGSALAGLGFLRRKHIA